MNLSSFRLVDGDGRLQTSALNSLWQESRSCYLNPDKDRVLGPALDELANFIFGTDWRALQDMPPATPLTTTQLADAHTLTALSGLAQSASVGHLLQAIFDE
jgi:hypothetical protein